MTETTERTRATSLAEMDERQAKLFTEENFAEAMKFELKPTDVVITPYAKCGTTWLQQIVHTLRTRGDMDFDDISRVVPWIETSPALGIDLTGPQKAEPRAFKSHLAADAIPKGGRYINSIRNPGDALISMHNFMEGWFLEPGAVTLEELARDRFIKKGEYWKHLLSWWHRRNDPDVLFLVYEHMKTDIRGTIESVAEFIEIELDDELLTITVKHASLDFMLKHKDRFDDVLMRTLSEQKANIPKGSDSSKVRHGKVGGRLSQEIVKGLDEIWEKEITGTIGYGSYEALIADLN
ncbi:MAG: sulfotransferase domain-containing protein [Gammaproteobacteria bacterium]|nr:sulfotransferase domain-containing protein [Gammaproteobacteria bacterium]